MGLLAYVFRLGGHTVLCLMVLALLACSSSAINARRLHDVGRSGWHPLLWLLAWIAPFWMIYSGMGLGPSVPEGNPYAIGMGFCFMVFVCMDSFYCLGAKPGLVEFNKYGAPRCATVFK